MDIDDCGYDNAIDEMKSSIESALKLLQDCPECFGAKSEPIREAIAILEAVFNG